MRRHTTQIEGKICAVLAGSMHFLGQWVRLHMAITLLDVLDHIAQHHRCEFVPEAQREDVNGIAIEHIRWRLQSSKHVSESAGGWFFSIGPSVLIGLFFFLGWKLPPPACPGTTGNYTVYLYWSIYLLSTLTVKWGVVWRSLTFFTTPESTGLQPTYWMHWSWRRSQNPHTKPSENLIDWWLRPFCRFFVVGN